MKKLFNYLLLSAFTIIAFNNVRATAAQTVVSQYSFNTLVDMRLQVGTPNVQVLLNGLTSLNDSNGGAYMWDAASVVADNGFTVIQVTGVTTGRWVRLANANTIKGNSTFSGTLLQTAYVVNHGLPFTPLQVYIQPKTANAASFSYVSNINGTSFTINFLTVPVIGSNNISFDWLVIKQ